jgi:hypothetical protein
VTPLPLGATPRHRCDPRPHVRSDRPGSAGEHDLQRELGKHVNGTARLMEPAAAAQAGLESRVPAGRGVRFWVVVDVEEAYIHCSKHLPRFAELPAEDAASVRRARTADYFGTAAERRVDAEDDAEAAS